MPRLYRKAKNKKPQVDPAVWRWLCDENPTEQDEDGTLSWDIFMLDGEWVRHYGGERDGLRKLWREVKGRVLDYWIPLHPGTRPKMWWRYSAPRIPAGAWELVAGTYLGGKLAAPRLQVSGAGGAPWDLGVRYWPAFEYGVPTLWMGFDAQDPPRFESEPNYLRRYNLLTAAEEKKLKPKDFDAVPVDILKIANLPALVNASVKTATHF